MNGGRGLATYSREFISQNPADAQHPSDSQNPADELPEQVCTEGFRNRSAHPQDTMDRILRVIATDWRSIT